MTTGRYVLMRPRLADLEPLTALCLRSKAWWGHDEAFIAACRDELTLTPDDLTASRMIVARKNANLAGIAQVALEGNKADLLKFFVDPANIGQGLGRILFEWVESEARRLGATTLSIESDPDAVAFYKRMGAVETGQVPSGSIPGRMLPLLEIILR